MGIDDITFYKKTISELSIDPFARLDFDYFFNLERFREQFSEKIRFKKLRDIVTLMETGQSVERKDYSPQGQESEYIHIVPRDIKNGGLDIREPIYLNVEKGEELSKFRLIKGDVLIAISSNCGDSTMFVPPMGSKHYSISHYIVRVRVNPKEYNSDFLVYYLNHPRIRTYFRAIEAGKLQQNLSKVYLRNFPVIDLPLEDQETAALALNKKRTEIAQKQTEIGLLKRESLGLVWTTINRSSAK